MIEVVKDSNQVHIEKELAKTVVQWAMQKSNVQKDRGK
jgi:hypothetical protein